jgi:hypothetical protein
MIIWDNFETSLQILGIKLEFVGKLGNNIMNQYQISSNYDNISGMYMCVCVCAKSFRAQLEGFHHQLETLTRMLPKEKERICFQLQSLVNRDS